MKAITVPELYPFETHEDATILLAAEDIPKYHYCEETLTDENFYIEPVKGPKAGGFLEVSPTGGMSFKFEDAIAALEALVEKTKRKFRFGTALEALLFFQQNRSVCSRYFIVPGTLWKDKVHNKILDWNPEAKKLNVNYADSGWFSFEGVFIVEDLKP